MQNHVPTKENCLALDKALKAKGMKPMETMFFGNKNPSVKNIFSKKEVEQCAEKYDDLGYDCNLSSWNFVPAPLVSELGEVLPFSIEAVGEFYYLTIDKARDYWHINYEDTDGVTLFKDTGLFTAPTEADARCLCLVYLINNDLLTN